ncbi:hypothetical protein HK096_001637, partial [Nowakowskiella sp. JEL0078]
TVVVGCVRVELNEVNERVRKIDIGELEVGVVAVGEEGVSAKITKGSFGIEVRVEFVWEDKISEEVWFLGIVEEIISEGSG